MKRTVLMLASLGLAVLLASGVSLAQTVEDTTPPATTLGQKPSLFSSNVSPSFSFTSDEANATFECKLDDATFGSCASPKQLFLLSEGQHTFQVRATDASGNVDPTPEQHTWTVDSTDPKITFTERPGNATGPDEYDPWVTKDRTPTWAWTVEEANLEPEGVWCALEDRPDYREIADIQPCYSPFTFEADLPDGKYGFAVQAYDKADNGGGPYNVFEVDSVAPKVVSGTPTGRRVSVSSDVVVTLDDQVYGSLKFVKVYKRGSTTPLAAYREYSWEDGDKKLNLDLKNNLRRDTRYAVKVGTGVTDGANNLEAPYSWNFRTR